MDFNVEAIVPAPNPHNRFRVVRSDGQLISMWATRAKAEAAANELAKYEPTDFHVTIARCPRCNGRVSVPSHVQDTGITRAESEGHFRPLAECHLCGVGFGWEPDTSKDLIGLNRTVHHGPTWFCDRPAPEFPAPHVVTNTLTRDQMYRFPASWKR